MGLIILQFGEVEDFELMKETVPKERYVIKEPKIHKRKAETAKLESIPSTSGTLEQVIQETAGTPITEYSPAPAPRTLEQVQETAAAATPITEYLKPAPGLDLVLDLCDDQGVLSWDHFASSFITFVVF
jgi:hypothetical protein